MGYMEGEVLGEMVGSCSKFYVLSRLPQTILYSAATGLGPQPKFTGRGSHRSGRFLVA